MNPLQEASAKFANALGEAVVRIWGHLPPEIQHKLFEEAVSRAEEIRPQLAIYLHEKHPRTVTSMQARAMPEPDSLGG